MRTIEWMQDRVRLIDQTQLPWRLVFLDVRNYKDMIDAMKRMAVRGAPALGIAGAYALVLAAQKIEAQEKEAFLLRLKCTAKEIEYARPTAVNLAWAVRRCLGSAESVLPGKDASEIKAALLAEAIKIQQEDESANRCIGSLGAQLIPQGSTILTHCNAGALATSAYGTALGVVRAAWERDKSIQVYATETRPLLQGARLTAWELAQEGIPVTLITDSMAGHFLRRGEIQCVVVGADRIAANGDAANKIGTYSLAVLAKENKVPFYVAAPTSTIDLSLSSGDLIPIEERSPEEVTRIQGVQIAPEGVSVRNPAFDVTPHKYITAIITEKGIVRKPYLTELRSILSNG